jgi:outer membrane lipoprotein SlyB
MIYNGLKFSSALVLGVAICLSGCVVEDPGMPSYPSAMRGQAMQVFQVQIISVQRVALRGESSVVGVGTGAIAGGVLGSMVGHGKAKTLATVGGAIAGGFAGDAVERKATSGTGLEIMVRTQSGQTWSVVQSDHGENFQRGEWVRMLVNGDKRTITR